MKYSVSTYSFSRIMQSEGITQLDCIPMAKEMGFDAVEILDFLCPTDVPKEIYADQVKEACAQADIEISNYTLQADFLTGSEGDTDKEVKRIQDEIDIAVRMGAKSIRHDATRGYEGAAYQSFDSCLDVLAAACRVVTQYGKEKGVATMVENHGFFAQEIGRAHV